MAKDVQQNALKPPSNIYTMLSIVSFVALVIATTLVFLEGDKHYRFWDENQPPIFYAGYNPDHGMDLPEDLRMWEGRKGAAEADVAPHQPEPETPAAGEGESPAAESAAEPATEPDEEPAQ